MTRARWMPALALAFAVFFTATLAGRPQPPQTRPIVGNPAANNPHLGNAESIRSGMALYRTRCADCHGMDATGYRGPDLAALMTTDISDERLFQTIRKGVPGTEMPPSADDPDDDLLMMIAYLRKLGTPAPAERAVGNVENGQRLFAAQCASCHRVAGQGRPARSRSDAGRHRAIARRAGPRDPHACRMGSADLRNGDGGDERRPARPRRQEERGRVLHPGDGHARAHPGLPEVEPAGSRSTRRAR